MNKTTRRLNEFFTEVERTDRVDGKTTLDRTVCACAAAGATRRGCAIVQGNKTPCRCDCHREEVTP